MGTIEPPKFGTPEWELWSSGSLAERHRLYQGMQPESVHVFDYVRLLAQRGDSPDRITKSTAMVFTASWTLRQRIRLAWKIVRRKH